MMGSLVGSVVGRGDWFWLVVDLVVAVAVDMCSPG